MNGAIVGILRGGQQYRRRCPVSLPADAVRRSPRPGLAADRWVRRLPLPAAGRRGTQATGAAVAVGGALLSLSGVLTALRQGTTVVPHHVVTQLVTTGPFRRTRNLMYTGHVIVLLGAALRTGSWWPLLVAPLCIRATTRLVILPEEDYLADRFGQDYQRYSTRVRRWI